MAFVEDKGKELVLVFSEEEFKKAKLSSEKEYEFVNVKPGVWVVVEREKKPEKKVDAKQLGVEQKIIEMITNRKLSERVEGTFEKLLEKEELPVFKRLLEEGRVIAFKLSDKYKKAVYKLAPEKGKESEQSNAKEKAIDEYELDTDGIMIIKNEQRAKKVSEQLKNEIQEGKIKGTKSFDGHFYIIDSDLYNKYREDLLQAIKASKGISLEELYDKINVSKILCKIVAEFLKEDGEIIEKTKEKYCYIS